MRFLRGSIYVIALVLVTGSPLVGAVHGVLEDFSGSDLHNRLTASGWWLSGDISEIPGHLVLQTVGGDGSISRLSRIVRGSGSFRTTFGFQKLNLGNVDLGGQSALSLLQVLGDGGLVVILQDNSEIPFGSWGTLVAARDHVLHGLVPSPNRKVQLVMEFDASTRNASFAWNLGASNELVEVASFPFEKGLDESNLLGLSLGSFEEGETLAILDFVSVIPLDTPLGDFSGDGILDLADIEMLSKALSIQNADKAFDLRNDSSLDLLDLTAWVHDHRKSYFGDANLDGEFNSQDLLAVFQAGEYEDTLENNSTWADGDWDADGEFSTGDLLVAFQDGGYNQGPRPVAVPEPNVVLLAVAGSLLASMRSRLSTRKAA